MVFSGLEFILRFMPVFFLIYFLIPKRCTGLRNAALLLGSLVFYAFGEPVYVFLMIFSIVLNYFLAKGVQAYPNGAKKNHGDTSRKFLLTICILLNLGILGVFKYAGFFAENINALIAAFGGKVVLSVPNLALPIGISFYTFQILSYVIDVYRGDYAAENNLITLGAYITMFPQLIAGPIVRYPSVRSRMQNRTVTPRMLDSGMKYFILGLSAKVILANRIGILWDQMEFIGYENVSTPLAWLGAFAFSFEIYYDFFGYSLMAIGLGKMLGFTLPRNFKNPYLSKSATEFWQRWHITLGSWFREYVYIPLGGNRHGIVRTILNLFVVWALTGLWHGASWNFVIWGLGYFVLLTIEKLFLKKWLNKSHVFCRIYMLLVIPVSWSVFAITDFADLGGFLHRLFPFGSSLFLYDDMTTLLTYLRQYGLYFFLCAFFLIPPVMKRIAIWQKKKWWFVIALPAFLYCLYSLAIGLNNPFMYFRF